MGVLFFLLAVASLILLVVGMIKPSCVLRWGNTNRRTVLISYSLFFLFFTICLIVSVVGSEHKKHSVIDHKLAAEYKVASIEDVSFAGRKRLSFSITSKDSLEKSGNEGFHVRAHTAIKAAIELQRKYKCDVAFVILEINKSLSGKGYSIARASFAPDNGGTSGKDGWTWEVYSSKTPVRNDELLVLNKWYEFRSKFQSDGMTDEPALKAYLAQKLNLPEEKITLPWFSPEPYHPQFG